MVAPSVQSSPVERVEPVVEYPLDWPEEGPINLSVHDRPHASSTTEWWYVNGHCVAEHGRRFSFFAAFFRQVKGRHPVTGAFEHVHSVTWALYDVDGEHAYTVSKVDPQAPAEGLKRIKRGFGSADVRLNRAMAESLAKGRVPLPDRPIEGRIHVATERLALDYGDDSYRRLDDGRYALRLKDPKSGCGVELDLTPKKAPVRHGANGVVRGAHDEQMFYYFIPRNSAEGTIQLNGQRFAVTQGTAWYDHEFGVGEIYSGVEESAELALDEEARAARHRARRSEYQRKEVGWDWLSVQLDDGTDISVYPLTYVYRGESAGNWTVVSDAQGHRTVHKDALFEHLEYWRSHQTFSTYPVSWHVRVPSAELDVQVRAAFPDQEFITLISKPSFWEGRVEVNGTLRGKPISGVGFVERSGFAAYDDLNGFFEQVGQVVRSSVQELVPLEPDYEAARKLIATRDNDRYLQGIDLAQYGRTHLAPIREIVDRGGKSWRSYAAITCCDIVGGDSRHFIRWLAMPELLHVGSLIVDDVQDRSDTRRGKPTAHLMYGEAQAINSGTAAYFLIWPLLQSDHVSDRDKLRIYDEYFYGMRAGHAGQAIDLDGFDALMDEVVESGDAELLVERVLGVHRLKTGAPAGCLARMGAIGGGGTDEQVYALGYFFEELGLSFQIIDDVLNLRGFKGNLKSRAEDVRQGKVTLPVAKAMGLLDVQERRWLRDTLRSLPEDDDIVMSVVHKLEACGAVDRCAEMAREHVESAWKQLDPLVEESMSKVMLRAFGWYLLERHY